MNNVEMEDLVSVSMSTYKMQQHSISELFSVSMRFHETKETLSITIEWDEEMRKCKGNIMFCSPASTTSHYINAQRSIVWVMCQPNIDVYLIWPWLT